MRGVVITLKSVPGTPGEAKPIPLPRGGDRRSAEFRERYSRARSSAELIGKWNSGAISRDEMIEGIVRIKQASHEQ